MASGNDNVLYLYIQGISNNVAANTTLCNWWIDLQVWWGVNARMTGNVTINGTVVWNNTDFNPGSLTYGNTYRIASGQVTIGHRSDGTAEVSGVANLATRQQGSTWSFSKSAGYGPVGLGRLTYAPSSPGTPVLQSRTTSSVTMTWTPPGDWGRDNTNLYVVRTYMANLVDFSDRTLYGTSFTYTGMAAGQVIYAYVAGINRNGNGAWSNRSVAMQAQILNPAAPPSAPTVERIADNLHRLTWSVTSTTEAPVTTTLVQRMNCQSGNWATIATLTGAPTTYTDTSTIYNQVYAWRIVAVNASGSVTGNQSACWPTTPAAPTGITTNRLAEGQFLFWDAPATWSPTARYDVRVSADGGATWTMLVTNSSGRSYLDTTIRSPALLYQVRGTTNPGYTTVSLTGPWSTSATVPALSPPGAPQALSPDGDVRDVTETGWLTWSYRSTDTSDQVAREVRWRVAGSSVWTSAGKVISLSASSSYPTAWVNGNVYEWSVRNWGLHPDPGPWSETASVTMSRRPTATINTPSADTPVDSSSATVAWTYWDAENTPQSRWVAKLFSADGSLLETKSGTNAVQTVTFDFHVLNQTTYSAQVVVTDGSGLDSLPATVTFTVDYAAPGIPLYWTTWDEDTASVILRLSPGPSTVETDYHDVFVSRDNGNTWYVLTRGLSPEGAVTDPRPNLRGPTLYATRSVNTTLNTSTLAQPLAIVEHYEPAGLAVLSFGRTLSNPVLISCNLNAPGTDARNKQLVHTSGNDFPLMIQSYYETQTVEVSGTVKVTGMQLEDLEERFRSLGPTYWRDYFGRSFWCATSEVAIGLMQSHADNSQIWVDLTFSVTRLASPELPVTL